MNKKGFVFIETLVVTTVLTVILLSVYASYSAFIVKERTRITYNDSVYLYRTYYVGKFLKNFNLYKMKNVINEKINNTNFLKSIALLDYNEIVTNEKEQKFTKTLIDELGIENMYLTFEDLRYLQNCDGYEQKCMAFYNIENEDTINYIKTIGGPTLNTYNDLGPINQNRYRLIIEYRLVKNGKTCQEQKNLCDNSCSSKEAGTEKDKCYEQCEKNVDKKCQSYYTTIVLGEIEGEAKN